MRLSILVALALTLCALTLAAPVLAREARVFNATIWLETRSDWANVEFRGFYLSRPSYEVVEGADAPGLRVRVEPWYASIGKASGDTTKVVVLVRCYIMALADNMTVVIMKGGLEYTNFTVYGEVNGSRVKVLEFVNVGVVPGTGGKNTRKYSFTVEDLAEGLSEVLRVRFLEDRLVLAFYYPWYGSPYGPNRVWSHWVDVGPYEIGSSAHYPLMGAYDSTDPAVIRAHILMAKSASIDGFICSWWGIGGIEDRAFKRMLDVAEELNFTVTVYYESVRPLTVDDAVEELSYIVESYSNRSCFLKLEGRPVIFIYGAERRSLDFWRQVFSEVENVTGVDIAFIVDSQCTAYLEFCEGLHIYSPLWVFRTGGNLTETYLKIMRRARSYVSEEDVKRGGVVLGKLFCAPAMPGYDDTKVRRPGTYLDRGDGEVYRECWRAINASDPDYALICTWNEWHEGTEIEPSREYEFRYLELTRRYALAFKEVEPAEGLMEPTASIGAVRVVELWPHRPSTFKVEVASSRAPIVALQVIVEVEGATLQGLNFYPTLLGDKLLVNVPLVEAGGRVEVLVEASSHVPTLEAVRVRIAYFDPTGKLHLATLEDL